MKAKLPLEYEQSLSALLINTLQLCSEIAEESLTEVVCNCVELLGLLP